MKSRPVISISGILSGVPFNTTKPLGKYVYQKTKKGLGNIDGDQSKRQQVRTWTTGTLRHTVKQQPYRLRFATGVATWAGMTAPQKETWRSPGRKLKLNRFQAFMRDWGRTKPTPTGTQWDGTITNWDTGQTTFDMPSPTFWDLGITTWDLSLTTFDTPRATVFDGNATTWDNDITTFFD